MPDGADRGSTQQRAVLQGRRILIVEDETVVAMLLEDLLTELGCHVVKIVVNVNAALAAIAAIELDLAILDVNLKGETSYPIAAELAQRHVPFLFATGYGAYGMPEEYQERTILQKPITRRELEAGLVKTLQA